MRRITYSECDQPGFGFSVIMFAKYGLGGFSAGTTDGSGSGVGGLVSGSIQSTVPQSGQLQLDSLRTFGTLNPGIITSLGGTLPAAAVGEIHGDLLLGQQDESDYSDPVVTAVVANIRFRDVGHDRTTDTSTTRRYWNVGQLVLGLRPKPGYVEPVVPRSSRLKRAKTNITEFEAYPALFPDITSANLDAFLKNYESVLAWPLFGQGVMYVQEHNHTAHFAVAKKNTAEIRVTRFPDVEDLLKRTGHGTFWNQVVSRHSPYGNTESAYEPGRPGDILSVIPILERTDLGVHIHYIPFLNVSRADRADILASLVRDGINHGHGDELARIVNHFFLVGTLCVSHNITDNHFIVSVHLAKQSPAPGNVYDQRGGETIQQEEVDREQLRMPARLRVREMEQMREY